MPGSTSARRGSSRSRFYAVRRSWPRSGFPLLLSASNKTFLGKLLDLEVDRRGDASAAAAAVGVMRGCRIVRAHDVRATKAVCEVLAGLREAAA